MFVYWRLVGLLGTFGSWYCYLCTTVYVLLCTMCQGEVVGFFSVGCLGYNFRNGRSMLFRIGMSIFAVYRVVLITIGKGYARGKTKWKNVNPQLDITIQDHRLLPPIPER